MRIVVLTGMSGSGKTNALRALEDVGFYAIDNLPVPLLTPLVQLFSSSQGEVTRLALVVDARTSELEEVPIALESIRKAGHVVDLAFLDTEDDVLVRRFSETRRQHPLATDGSVRSGIAAERALLEPLHDASTLALDTSGMSVHDLRRTTQEAFRLEEGDGGARLRVSVLSFGFKYGLPPEADLVFDVRFIPNPYFVEGLRPLTGQDPAVASYVLDRDETRELLARVQELLAFLLPQYEREGKAYLTVAVGCTGGRHRSVAIAGELARWIETRGVTVRPSHRDVGR